MNAFFSIWLIAVFVYVSAEMIHFVYIRVKKFSLPCLSRPA